jgi:hypothetical protein
MVGRQRSTARRAPAARGRGWRILRCVRALAAALAVLLAPGSSAAGSALSRLAAAFADQVAAVSRGAPIELASAEDRTGRGGTLALDVAALVVARLGGRAVLVKEGTRLRIAPVLSESGGRFVLSARVTEEPGGRLVEILSASAETGADALALVPMRPPASAQVDVAGLGRTPPLDAPVLDLAWTGADELAVLTPEALALYRLSPDGLTPEARQPIPARLSVRAPAGLLLAAPAEDALWVLSNRAGGALLFGREGGRLVPRGEGEALPWPGSRTGLRYRHGTNLLDGAVPGLGDGPFLEVLAGGGAAVAPDGRLLLPRAPSEAAARVGPCLAALWPPLIAAASADPPGPTDRLLLVDGASGRSGEALRVDGAIRALAALPTPQGARVGLGVMEPDATHRLGVSELRRREP